MMRNFKILDEAKSGPNFFLKLILLLFKNCWSGNQQGQKPIRLLISLQATSHKTEPLQCFVIDSCGMFKLA
jgi:hypothetical protein